MPSFAFAHSDSPTNETSTEDLDRIVAALGTAAPRWSATGLAERIELLEGLARRIVQHTDRWVEAVLTFKGPADPAVADTIRAEALQNVYVSAQGVRQLIRTLKTIHRTGRPPEPAGGWSTRGDGRLVAHTLPSTFWERLLYLGFRAEVWMKPGVTRENIHEHQARAYREPPLYPDGRVMLVLGAGNQSSIPFLDALHALFAENSVVVLKMNPVNEAVGPVLRDLFEEFVARDWFEVVYGGVSVGKHLTHHDGVHAIHITGSDATHDAIVWGSPRGRAGRKARGQRSLNKPITSELGNVTPLIVAGGDWTDKDYRFNVPNAALGVIHNASFNCLATKVIVLPAAWPGKERFLREFREYLRETPTRYAFYPGARDRWRRFLDAHPDAHVLSEDRDDVVPWTVIEGLDPEAEDEICFTTEAFCGVVGVVELPGDTPADFLANAVRFCNERLWGTLACSMLVHPSIRRDPVGEAAFQLALDELRYGAIAVNTTPMVNYGVQTLPWGAYPGHTLEDIGSGIGHVHNALLFDDTEKGVTYMRWNYGLYGHLVPPPFMPTHRRSLQTYAQFARFEADQSIARLPALFVNFLRG